jgi:hypothetical protein
MVHEWIQNLLPGNNCMMSLTTMQHCLDLPAHGTWAFHGQDAWYIGPALDHYHCYTVWMWDTCCEWETDTLTWFPQQVTMPTLTAVDIIAAGIQDITTTLSDTKPNSPKLQCYEIWSPSLLALCLPMMPWRPHHIWGWNPKKKGSLVFLHCLWLCLLCLQLQYHQHQWHQ